MNDTLKQRVADEIANDPLGLGYAGKTPQEIVDLINNPRIETVTTTKTKPSIMSQIIDDVKSQIDTLPANLLITKTGISDNAVIQDMINTAKAKYPAGTDFTAEVSYDVTEQVTGEARIMALIIGIESAPNILTVDYIN
jgi:hypothetical protein